MVCWLGAAAGSGLDCPRRRRELAQLGAGGSAAMALQRGLAVRACLSLVFGSAGRAQSSTGSRVDGQQLLQREGAPSQ